MEDADTEFVVVEDNEDNHEHEDKENNFLDSPNITNITLLYTNLIPWQYQCSKQMPIWRKGKHQKRN